MGDRTENAALVVLLRGGTRSWSAYAEMVEEAGSAQAVLDREHGNQSSLFARDELEAAARQIDQWQQRGMRLVTVLDPDYPQNLRAAHDRPPLVFVAGTLEPRDARGVAVVGARAASPAGRQAATRIAAHLIGEAFTVLSGLATGIDAAAHGAALEAGGRTIAVVGTGLMHCYPPQHVGLQRRIAATCAVLSPFWPDSPPTRRSFPIRNAVMSGAARATVVVEASATSGARMQARLSLAQGRPVFLFAPLLEQEWARAYAERPGTHVFDEPQEITHVVERLTPPSALVR
jgi:DNA processing protein